MGKDKSNHSSGKADDSREAPGAGQDGGAKESTKGVKSQNKRPSTAFDLWLQRELQDMFSDVSREPIPDELLRLIDDGKPKPK